MISFHTYTEPWQRTCQDRALVLPHPQGIVAILADGAGGSGNGAAAADTVLMWARSCVERTANLRNPAQWTEFLTRLDHQIAAAEGETTAVIAALFDGGISGASVGDSVAWLISPDSLDDLTQHQHRKPLLGTGRAIPIPFDRPHSAGTLLLTSDGITNYAPRTKIADAARTTDLEIASRKMAALARLKSGALPDDIGIILCRKSD